MEKKYTIYMHRNKLNNKVYIGQTCQKPEYRWNNGKNYSHCNAFFRAITKYGWDNFEHIILFEGLSQEEANQKEIELINLYHSTDRNYGYNCQLGGNNKTISEDGKISIAEANRQRWSNEDYHKKMSDLMIEKWDTEEYRQKVLNSCEKARQKHFEETGSRCFMTEDSRKRVSEARKEYMKNNKEKYSHKIKCLNTGEEFSSYVEAAKWAGMKSSSGFTTLFNGSGRLKTLGKHPETGEKLEWERIN